MGPGLHQRSPYKFPSAAGVQLVFAATALVLRAAAMTGRGIGKSAGIARGRGRSASKQAASRLNKPGRASDVNPVALADDDPQVQGRQPEIRPGEGEWRPEVTGRAVSASTSDDLGASRTHT